MLRVEVIVPDLSDIAPSDEEIKQALNLVGGEYLRLQTERINRGVDAAGRPFRPYSPQYRINKVLAGRKRDSWLRLTGKMLRSQKVRVKRRAGSMYMAVSFIGTRADARIGRRSKKIKGQGPYAVTNTGRRIANTLLAEYNDRIRPFVGVTPSEAERLKDVYVAALRRSGKKKA